MDTGTGTIDLNFAFLAATYGANLLFLGRTIPLPGPLRAQRTTWHNRRSIAVYEGVNQLGSV